MQEDIPHLGLMKGDRLTATAEYPDIASLCVEEAPSRAIWWRQSNETMTRFRNPLFRRGAGITLLTLGIDWLLVLSLGVIQDFMALLIWAFF